jgi:C-terminal processing protease CtpA/Prc
VEIDVAQAAAKESAEELEAANAKAQTDATESEATIAALEEAVAAAAAATTATAVNTSSKVAEAPVASDENNAKIATLKENRDDAVRERDAALAELEEEKASHKSNNVEEKNAEIATLKESRDVAVRERDAALAELEEEKASHESDNVEEKNAEIATLKESRNVAVRERDAALAELEVEQASHESDNVAALAMAADLSEKLEFAQAELSVKIDPASTNTPTKMASEWEDIEDKEEDPINVPMDQMKIEALRMKMAVTDAEMEAAAAREETQEVKIALEAAIATAAAKSEAASLEHEIALQEHAAALQAAVTGEQVQSALAVIAASEAEAKRELALSLATLESERAAHAAALDAAKSVADTASATALGAAREHAAPPRGTPAERALSAVKAEVAGCYVVWISKEAEENGSNGMMLTVSDAADSAITFNIVSRVQEGGDVVYYIEGSEADDAIFPSMSHLIQHYCSNPLNGSGLVLEWAVSMGSSATPVRRVTVARDNGTSTFGFILIGGGTDKEPAAYVQNVGQGDAVDLITGDKILEVNGQSVKGMSHTAVFKRMQERDRVGPIELTVRNDVEGAGAVARATRAKIKRSQSSIVAIESMGGAPRAVTVSGCRENPDNLGISVISDEQRRIFICDVVPTGAAALNGDVHRGDQIVSCHGVQFEGLTHDDALNILSTAKDVVEMTVVTNAEAWNVAMEKQWIEWPSHMEADSAGNDTDSEIVGSGIKVSISEAAITEEEEERPPRKKTSIFLEQITSSERDLNSDFVPIDPNEEDTIVPANASTPLRRFTSNTSQGMQVTLARPNTNSSFNISVVSVEHGEGYEPELYVAGIDPTSEAGLAGLQDGDRIVGIDGNTDVSHNADSFREYISTRERIEVHAVRGDGNSSVDEAAAAAPMSPGTPQRQITRRASVSEIADLYDDVNESNAADAHADIIMHQHSISELASAASPTWHPHEASPTETTGQRLRIEVANLDWSDSASPPFTFSGGTNSPYGAVFVTGIKADLPSSSVAAGDRILAINGTCVLCATDAVVRGVLASALAEQSAVLFVLRPSEEQFASVETDVRAARAGQMHTNADFWIRPLTLALGDNPPVDAPVCDLEAESWLPSSDGAVVRCTVIRENGTLGLSVVPLLGATFIIKTMSEGAKILEYGDRILSVNGQCMSIGSTKDATNALKASGETVELVIHRTGLQKFNRLYLQPPPYTPQRSASYDGQTPSPLLMVSPMNLAPATPAAAGPSPGELAAVAAVEASFLEPRSDEEDGAGPADLTFNTTFGDAVGQSPMSNTPPQPPAADYGEVFDGETDLQHDASFDRVVDTLNELNFPSNHQSVTLLRQQPSDSWGFAIRAGCDDRISVSAIVPNSPASGHFQMHDLLLALNGQSTAGMTNNTAVSICKQPNLQLHAHFLRTATGDPGSEGGPAFEPDADADAAVEAPSPPPSLPIESDDGESDVDEQARRATVYDNVNGDAGTQLDAPDNRDNLVDESADESTDGDAAAAGELAVFAKVMALNMGAKAADERLPAARSSSDRRPGDDGAGAREALYSLDRGGPLDESEEESASVSDDAAAAPARESLYFPPPTHVQQSIPAEAPPPPPPDYGEREEGAPVVEELHALGQIYHISTTFSESGRAPFELMPNDSGELTWVVAVDDDDEDAGDGANRIQHGDVLLALNQSNVAGLDGDEALDAAGSGQVVVSVLRLPKGVHKRTLVTARASVKPDGTWRFKCTGGQKLGCTDGIFIQTAEPAVAFQTNDRLVVCNGRNMLAVRLVELEYILEETTELEMLAIRIGDTAPKTSRGNPGGDAMGGAANYVHRAFDFSSDEDEGDAAIPSIPSDFNTLSERPPAPANPSAPAGARVQGAARTSYGERVHFGRGGGSEPLVKNSKKSFKFWGKKKKAGGSTTKKGGGAETKAEEIEMDVTPAAQKGAWN